MSDRLAKLREIVKRRAQGVRHASDDLLAFDVISDLVVALDAFIEVYRLEKYILHVPAQYYDETEAQLRNAKHTFEVTLAKLKEDEHGGPDALAPRTP